jgi:hypothetical protein
LNSNQLFQLAGWHESAIQKSNATGLPNNDYLAQSVVTLGPLPVNSNQIFLELNPSTLTSVQKRLIESLDPLGFTSEHIQPSLQAREVICHISLFVDFSLILRCRRSGCTSVVGIVAQ